MSDSQDSLSLSGLEYYGPGDYLRMFGRRRWPIIITMFAVALATSVVAYFWPNSYKTTTVIVVDPQKIPENYVNSTVTIPVVDRLAALREQILSATRLNQVIEEMGLQKIEKKSQEKILELMRKSITVELVATRGQKVLEAFSITYSNSNPVVAAEVTNRLASLFIGDNIKSREQSVLGTANFLTTELEDARKDLKHKEDQITVLKLRYADALPESGMMHMEQLNLLRPELQSEKDALERAQQQKATLLSKPGELVHAETKEAPEVAALETQLSTLQTELDTLRSRYGPAYPDVQKTSMRIQELKARIEKAKSVAAKAAGNASVGTTVRDPAVQSEIAKLDDEIKKHQQKIDALTSQIADHESKLQNIPIYQSQISAVMRDYEAAQDHYKRLIDRKFSADMATDLEVGQKGERFEVLDPAQVPLTPDSPNRPLINMIGLGCGLVLGFAVALALEIVDPSVKTEREVVGHLGAPVFAEIPWLPTQSGKRRELWRTIFACTASLMMAAAYSVLLFVAWR